MLFRSRQPFDPRPPPPPLDATPPPPLPAEEALLKPTFNRYYHLFRQHELSHLVASAALSLGASFVAPPTSPILCLDSLYISPAPSPSSTTGANPTADLASSSLEPPRSAVAKPKDDEGLGREGWKLQVALLKGEKWERENWTVEIGVRWIRVGGGD